EVKVGWSGRMAMRPAPPVPVLARMDWPGPADRGGVATRVDAVFHNGRRAAAPASQPVPVLFGPVGLNDERLAARQALNRGSFQGASKGPIGCRRRAETR